MGVRSGVAMRVAVVCVAFAMQGGVAHGQEPPDSLEVLAVDVSMAPAISAQFKATYEGSTLSDLYVKDVGMTWAGQELLLTQRALEMGIDETPPVAFLFVFPTARAYGEEWWGIRNTLADFVESVRTTDYVGVLSYQLATEFNGFRSGDPSAVANEILLIPEGEQLQSDLIGALVTAVTELSTADLPGVQTRYLVIISDAGGLDHSDANALQEGLERYGSMAQAAGLVPLLVKYHPEGELSTDELAYGLLQQIADQVPSTQSWELNDSRILHSTVLQDLRSLVIRKEAIWTLNATLASASELPAGPLAVTLQLLQDSDLTWQGEVEWPSSGVQSAGVATEPGVEKPSGHAFEGSVRAERGYLQMIDLEVSDAPRVTAQFYVANDGFPINALEPSQIGFEINDLAVTLQDLQLTATVTEAPIALTIVMPMGAAYDEESWQLRQHIAPLIESLGDEDEVTLVAYDLWTRVLGPASGDDRPALLAELAALEPSSAIRNDLPLAFNTGVETLLSARPRRRILLVISDVQGQDWSLGDDEWRQRMRTHLRDIHSHNIDVYGVAYSFEGYFDAKEAQYEAALLEDLGGHHVELSSPDAFAQYMGTTFPAALDFVSTEWSLQATFADEAAWFQPGLHTFELVVNAADAGTIHGLTDLDWPGMESPTALVVDTEEPDALEPDDNPVEVASEDTGASSAEESTVAQADEKTSSAGAVQALEEDEEGAGNKEESKSGCGCGQMQRPAPWPLWGLVLVALCAGFAGRRGRRS